MSEETSLAPKSPERTPSKPGVWRFTGYRYTGKSHQIRTMGDVVLVRREKVNRELSLYVLLFGSTKKHPVQNFIGVWKYLGKEKEVEERSIGDRAASTSTW